MKIGLKILLASLVAALFIGCSNPGVMGNGYEEGSEVPQIDYNMDKLRSIPYMGGSLIYNAADAGAGHLQAGMKVPFRLGEVEVVFDAEMQENTFADVEAKAKLGYLTISAINGEQISFSYVIYNNEGRRVRKGSLTLTKGEKADLDRDGDMDISFAAPTRDRAGFEGVTLLKFLSSQEERSTSMYSLLEEQFSGNSYPAGIMGLNPEEALLLNSTSIPTNSRTVIEGERLGSFDTYGEQGISQGDFVMNAGNGEYAAVSTVSTTRSGGTAVELDYSNEDTVFSALPLLYFNYDSIIDVTESMGAQARGETRGEIANFPGYKSKTLFNISKRFTLTNGVYAELKNLKGQIGFKASGSASWSRVKADVRVAFYISTSVNAVANKRYRVSKKLFHKTFPLAKIAIPIGPVVITVGGNAVVGADLNFNAQATASASFSTGALVGAYAGLDAGIRWKKVWFVSIPTGVYANFNRGVLKDYYFRLTKRPTLKGDLSTNLKLYGGLQAEVTLWNVVYVNSSIKPYVRPGITATLRNRRVTVNGVLDAGVNAGDLRLGVRIWKFKKEKVFGDIFSYNRRLWSKVLYKNY